MNPLRLSKDFSQGATHARPKPGSLARGLRWRREVVAVGFLLCAVLAVQAQSSVTLTWNQSTNSVAGYYVYWGTNSRTYNVKLDAAKNLQKQVGGLAAGTTYFFAVSSYNSAGMESVFSSEVSYTTSSSALPPPEPTLKLQVLANKQALLTAIAEANHSYDILASTNLKTWTVIGTVTSDGAGNLSFTDTGAPTFPARFYRLRG